METQIGSATLTAAGNVTGTLDISAAAPASTFTQPVMLRLVVSALTAASGVPRARIVIEDSVDAFTNALPIAFANVEGPIQPGAAVSLTFARDHIPSLRNGVTSAVIRARVAELTGTTPSITVAAYLDN